MARWLTRVPGVASHARARAGLRGHTVCAPEATVLVANSTWQRIGIDDTYSANMRCAWLLTSEPGYHIQLIVRTQLEDSLGCAADAVEVSTASSGGKPARPLETTCGVDTATVTMPDGLDANVTFRSDASVQHRGFYVAFRLLATTLGALGWYKSHFRTCNRF